MITYKASILLLLLSSLVTRKYSIDIATEQSFRYMEIIDAKIWISKMHHYGWILKI